MLVRANAGFDDHVSSDWLQVLVLLLLEPHDARERHLVLALVLLEAFGVLLLVLQVQLVHEVLEIHQGGAQTHELMRLGPVCGQVDDHQQQVVEDLTNQQPLEHRE